MTLTVSKILVIVAVVIFAFVAITTSNLVAAGLAVWAASQLV